MCGIAGFLSLDPAAPAEGARARRMIDTLSHRGPDGDGVWTDGPVALGHRRLAIIDLATGAQPMLSWDGAYAITYNGEIYNHVEVRRELELRGHHFVTRSDTEVILEAYRAWGTSCVDQLNGMWSFALWDVKERTLFCSRDRAGEKPLFWAVHDGCFAFASEIKALWAFGVPKELDPTLLDTYLSLTYVPAPRSFYKGIEKLPPASSLLVGAGAPPSTWRWWEPVIAGADRGRHDTKRILEEFEALFRDAVRIRMRSDVPVGAFLSGGLDSSSVVSAMRGHAPNPTRTFTIGFSEPRYDERDLARQVARSFGTAHHEKVVEPEEAVAVLETIARCYDEPFGDSSALPTLAVSRVAREQVKVVLTGDGGDEVLDGYTIHLGEWIGRAVSSAPLVSAAARVVRHTLAPRGPKGLLRTARALDLATRPFVERLEEKQSGIGPELRDKLLAGRTDVEPVREVIEQALLPVAGRDTMAQLEHWLLHVSLPDDMLTKVDRASMAVSLEARVPFLDHRLIELLASVNASVKLGGLRRKRVLRDTIGKELPRPLLHAPKKGFGVPLEVWLAGDGMRAVVERARVCAEAGLVDGGALAALEAAPGRESAVALWVLAMLSYAVR